MAFLWRADDGLFMAIFGSSIPSSTKTKKKNKKEEILNLDPLWQNFLDPRMSSIQGLHSFPLSRYILQTLSECQFELVSSMGYKLECAYNKDWNQSANSESKISAHSCATHRGTIKDSDQTARMRRLVWFFMVAYANLYLLLATSLCQADPDLDQLNKDGPWREKPCLLGFRQSEIQISLLSYRV